MIPMEIQRFPSDSGITPWNSNYFYSTFTLEFRRYILNRGLMIFLEEPNKPLKSLAIKHKIYGLVSNKI